MPTAPKPIAKVVRFRRSHLLVADIILYASLGLVTNADLEQGEKGDCARAFKGWLGCGRMGFNFFVLLVERLFLFLFLFPFFFLF